VTARSARGRNTPAARALEHLARGNVLPALAAWRAASQESREASAVELARPVMDRAEGRIALRPASDRPSIAKAIPPSPAWERAWAGDLEAALARAAGAPENASTLGVRGAVLVLQGRAAEALPVLDRALELGAGEDVVLHRARALVHLGRQEEASASLASLGDGEGFARRVVIALVDASLWARKVPPSEVYLNGLFSRELPSLLGPAAFAEAMSSRAELVACLERLLVRMAGNLGPVPTLATTGAVGERGFTALVLPRSPRDVAAETLFAVREVGPEATDVALARLVEQAPTSVHGHCYRGELMLWLGRYEEALRCFRATRAIEPARWADVGTFAVFALTGRHVRAAAMERLAHQRFPPIATSTLPVYRGVLRRRTGDLAGAVDDLRAALAAKPSRTGARIELCLALRASGAREEATARAAELVREAAPLLVSSADALGLDWRSTPAYLVGDGVLEHALEMMRGNRSSSVVTWFVGDGTMRALTPPKELSGAAQIALSASFT
jgi:tetratricopeptide (TPR) repeat protein